MTPAGNDKEPEGGWPEPLLGSVSQLPVHNHLYIALSGGLDSVLLLHTVARIFRDEARPTAIHINHQIQPNASEVEHFCQDLCQILAVPCRTVRVNVPAANHQAGITTGGLEESARNARYQAFESVLGEDDLLLMAHHADDQVETVLFRLVRGSGVAGLGGIPVCRALGQGKLWRPFLSFSRAQLQAWARQTGICWMEDPSNRNQIFDRNFLRHSVIPVLRTRWPNLERRLGSTAQACREQDELAEHLASIQFSRCRGAEGGILLAALAELTAPEQKNLIRWWLQQHKLSPPQTRDWPGLLSEFINAGADRQPEYRGPGYHLRRHRGTLRLVLDNVQGKQTLNLEPGLTQRWGNWWIRLESTAPKQALSPELRIRARKGGERLRVRPDGPSKPLKKWLQEQNVPAWERTELPLVMEQNESGSRVVAVGDLWVAEPYCGETPGSGWRLILERDCD